MSQKRIVVEMPELSRAEANRGIEDLRALIEKIATARGLNNEVDASIIKTNHQSQDLGATLLLVIGTPAALAIAKGIHDFIASYGHKVVISIDGKSVIAHGSGAANIDIARTVAALQSA